MGTVKVATLIQQGPFKRIQTTDGYYDLLHKTAYLGKRPTIVDSSSVLVADEVAADDSSGFAEARGMVVFKDTAQGMVVLCNDLKSSRENASFLATINPIAIIKQETDSIFIAADTLYSSRFANDDSLSINNDSLHLAKDSPGSTPDSVGDQKTKDRFITDHLPATVKDSLDLQQGLDTSLVAVKKDSSQPAAPAAGYHKVGKVFVWDQDSTHPESGEAAADSTKQQKEDEGERSGLFDFFKRKKDKDNPKEPPTLVADSTHPVQEASGPKKKKKSILDIFKRKDKVDKGKRQPGIIDSIKASKPNAVIDSTGGKPGLDFSIDKSGNAQKDSMPPEDKKNRFLEAYYNVRIYSDSLQGIGDSMYYSGRDSIIKLFKDPAIWTTSNHQVSQISGDTIVVQTANNKPKYIRVADNALMISQADSLHQDKTSKFFNQMAGNKLEAWFTGGQIDSLSTQGNAHGIFYSLDDDNKYIGVTQQDSRVLNFYFLNKELQRIVGKKDIVGRVYPMGEVDHEKIRLKGFKWMENQRPKSKYDLLAH